MYMYMYIRRIAIYLDLINVLVCCCVCAVHLLLLFVLGACFLGVILFIMLPETKGNRYCHTCSSLVCSFVRCCQCVAVPGDMSSICPRHICRLYVVYFKVYEFDFMICFVGLMMLEDMEDLFDVSGVYCCCCLDTKAGLLGLRNEGQGHGIPAGVGVNWSSHERMSLSERGKDQQRSQSPFYDPSQLHKYSSDMRYYYIIYLSIYLSIYISIYLSIYLSIIHFKRLFDLFFIFPLAMSCKIDSVRVYA